MSEQDPFETIDELTQRAIASVMTLVRRAMAFSGGVLMIAIVLCVGGFLLGVCVNAVEKDTLTQTHTNRQTEAHSP